MRFSFILLEFYLLVPAAVNVRASFPKPFELSFSDESYDSCNDPPEMQPEKIMKSNVSLCFSQLEDAAEHLLRWRAMYTSFQMENKTAHIDMRIRRVVIFAPGATVALAGRPPVSVFSRLQELEIGTHYNGFGEVSDPTNNSIIFKGQLNATVFEGHIIYRSLNRSHTIRCFHDNFLGPDFYQADDCLACIINTYDTHHNPDSAVGWRSNGHSPCSMDRNVSSQAMFSNQTGIDTNKYNKSEESLGFPQTGYSDYNMGTSDPYVPDERVNASRSVKDGVPREDAQNTRASELNTETENMGHQKINQTSPSFIYIPMKRKIIVPSVIKPISAESLLKNFWFNSSRVVISSQKRSASQTNQRDNREMQTSSNMQFADVTRTSHSVIQQTSRFARSTYKRLLSSHVPHSDSVIHATRRLRNRSPRRSDASELRTTHSEDLRPKSRASQPWNQSYIETISCPLHLVADHLFFNEIGEKSPSKTVNLMLSVVIGADAVFRATDFDGDGVRDNIGFMVKNITIIHNASTAFYQYSRTNDNSFEYLKSFSTGDFSDVCLGVAFTAIDFQRGVVGLAWYATSQSGGAGKGGICGQRVYMPNEGTSFSFNTAIVSFLNHGAGVSMEKAILTMAHEFGHCFGSTHDDMAGSPCNKAYPGGSYLMQTFRPIQYLPNNYKFSPCSLLQMYPVIVQKGDCLLRYTGPTCGNGVVEEGEECDCGLSGVCQFNDPCCSPGDASPSSADPPCRVRRSLGLECSPVTFSCCSEACKHISLADRYVCREAGDCYSQASCDGQSPLCPGPSFLQDGTLCHGGIRTCIQGRCRQSLCSQNGLQDCFCQDRSENLCKLCCQLRAHENSLGCQPAHVFNITSAADHDIYLPEGDACLNFRGVCTASQGRNKGKMFCATTDGLDGEPFSALIGLWGEDRKERSGGIGVTWLNTSWYYLLLIPLAPFLLMVAFLCGHGIRVKLRSSSRDDNIADSNRHRSPTFAVAAQNQPIVFHRETEKASDLHNSKFSPLVVQQQHQVQLPQQRQLPVQSNKCLHQQYQGRRSRQEITIESSKGHRSLIANPFPMYHSERPQSRKKTSREQERDQYGATGSLYILDSASLNTPGMSLPVYYREQGPRNTTARSQASTLQLLGSGTGGCKSCSVHKRRSSRNQKIPLGPSRKKLRAAYSKQSLRLPLPRRRIYPMEAKRTVMGLVAGNRNVRYFAGDHGNKNSQIFFHRPRSRLNSLQT